MVIGESFYVFQTIEQGAGAKKLATRRHSRQANPACQAMKY
jgi:hypothetical protein